MPPELLILIPDFLNKDVRDRATIALTHVCRDWREIFTSCPSLWTDFECRGTKKTLVYLHRSKSSPINVLLKRYVGVRPYDPLFQFTPHVIGRLKSLTIHGTPEGLREITPRLSHRAPLLESLAIHLDTCTSPPQYVPVVTTALFGGDLSSLRKLSLIRIRTELPWRNMVNFTSFTLRYTACGDPSVRHLLDFFESAPRLCKIKLESPTPTADVQIGRIVSLACLKRLDIIGGGPPSILLDHLLIPAGATFTLEGHQRDRAAHLPGSFDCLKEFTAFSILLHVREFYPSIRLGGPEWKIGMVPVTLPATTTCKVLESLAQFDPLKVERLRISDGDLMLRGGSKIHRVLLPMHNLRTLTISRCQNLSSFVVFLKISRLCHWLEELVLDPRDDMDGFDIQNVIGLAESRKTKLKSVRIVNQDGFPQAQVSKLEEYVPHVECGPGAASTNDNFESSDEED